MTAARAKPEALPVCIDAIPADLTAMRRWVVWRYVADVDKETGEVDWDKPPLCVRGGAASSTNPKTWAAFVLAAAAYRQGGLDGVGFVLHRERGEDGKEEQGGLVGVDLDHCRNRETGEIAPWALEFIRELDTYTEASPSGEGVRLFLYGDLPARGRKKGDFECYQSGRYVTVTGQRIDGTPAAVATRQEQMDRVHRRIFGDQEQSKPRGPWAAQQPPTLVDAELIRRASESKVGAKFSSLWRGEIVGHNSASEADLALCNYLAFWCGPDENRIADLFAQSGLYRSKWNREDYRKRTIGKALANRTEFYKPGRNGGTQAASASKPHKQNGNGRAETAEASAGSPTPVWHAPIPFDAAYNLPPFPTHPLPTALRAWVEAEALATQTPPDLAGTLAISVCGAALAGKVRVVVRDGWSEPTNLFTVVALAPGERKSIVHRHALAPVVEFETEEQDRMAPVIASAASEHRQMEARLKRAEQEAAKADDPAERQHLSHEAKELAKELAKHVVPEPPQMFCDDVTPEALGRLLAKQGGRMLQASPEGTAFEIVKGRYSESPNFDVYLKGHAGDPLRVGRIGRDSEMVDQPALSAALAVQPDVIQGLAEHAMLRGRGFLARWLYAMPVSKVGSRKTAASPVPKAVEAAYREAVLRLWRLEGAVEDGKPAAHLLQFSPEADRRMQEFETWLEPQLAEGEELSVLAGWANKAAGAAARIACGLHVTEALSTGQPWYRPIDAQTVAVAIMLVRDYFLPHAQAAFAAMGADGKIADARHVWTSIGRRQNEFSECSENGGPCLSRRDIHQWNRRRFPAVETLDPVLALLVDRYYLRPVGGTALPGRGHASPVYEVNPLALAALQNEAPRSHCTQRTHPDAEPAPNECSECSENPPPRLETQEMAADPPGGYADPTYRDDANPFRQEEEI